MQGFAGKVATSLIPPLDSLYNLYKIFKSQLRFNFQRMDCDCDQGLYRARDVGPRQPQETLMDEPRRRWMKLKN